MNFYSINLFKAVMSFTKHRKNGLSVRHHKSAPLTKIKLDKNVTFSLNEYARNFIFCDQYIEPHFLSLLYLLFDLYVKYHYL